MKMHNGVRFSLVLVAVLTCAITALAQVQNGQLTGTVTDPTVFTRPWTMGWNYVRSKGQEAQGEIWENACVEGNRFPEWDAIYARELAPK